MSRKNYQEFSTKRLVKELAYLKKIHSQLKITIASKAFVGSELQDKKKCKLALKDTIAFIEKIISKRVKTNANDNKGDVRGDVSLYHIRSRGFVMSG